MKESEERLSSAASRKARIRERYRGVSADALDVIPAIPQEDIFNPKAAKRVAVYARVSTDDPNQTSSYELQRNYYYDMVNSHDDWNLVDIYADEGISGTSLKHRDAFNRMIRDCEDGKIDLIVTKSVSRFARNIIDCIGEVRRLKKMNPPVGVFFETENIYTLKADSEMSLAFIATLAQEESHNKSEIMNASIEMRFKRGIFLTPTLLGYDHDADGNLIINEEEAKTVRLIFFSYLYGCTCSEIAATLTELKRTTKKGNTTWSPASVFQILKNERYCGDVLARKTWTPDYLTHKPKKNEQERNQYRMKDHHEAIISRDDFNAVQLMMRNHDRKSNPGLPVLHVVQNGALKGFIPVNPTWEGFTVDNYLDTCASADAQSVQEQSESSEFIADEGEFDLRGFEVVRGQFFQRGKLVVTFSADRISFSGETVRKFDGDEFIELLVHPRKQIIAVRPARSEIHNSVRWAGKRRGTLYPRIINCSACLPALFCLFGWNSDNVYRISGTYHENGEERVLLFDLEDCEITLPTDAQTDIREEFSPLRTGRAKRIVAYPAQWSEGFGEDYYIRADAQQNHILSSGTWNTAVPAEAEETADLPQYTTPAEAQEHITRLIEEFRENADTDRKENDYGV